MRLTINGQEHDCEAIDLAELWHKETADLDGAEPRGFAISLNGVVIRRTNWTTTAVHDGDAIEIVHAVPGG